MKKNIEKHSNSFGIDASIMILEKHNKRQYLLIVILIVALLVSNGFWFYRESKFQMEEITTEVTQEVESEKGGNATINDGVEVNNGTSKTDSKNHN